MFGHAVEELCDPGIRLGCLPDVAASVGGGKAPCMVCRSRQPALFAIDLLPAAIMAHIVLVAVGKF